jgi:hypothetical protein
MPCRDPPALFHVLADTAVRYPVGATDRTGVSIECGEQTYEPG